MLRLKNDSFSVAVAEYSERFFKDSHETVEPSTASPEQIVSIQTPDGHCPFLFSFFIGEENYIPPVEPERE